MLITSGCVDDGNRVVALICDIQGRSIWIDIYT